MRLRNAERQFAKLAAGGNDVESARVVESRRAQGLAPVDVPAQLVEGHGQRARVARSVSNASAPDDFSHTGEIGVDNREPVGLGLDEDESESLRTSGCENEGVEVQQAGVLPIIMVSGKP
ncbi:hypothetical protein [Streptomyces sp. PsTaAH-130]|uniref:hypothetical protein n=1 Tax=Streptomyces sp. SID8366 TaxID=2690348 RepID=UPI001EEFAFC3|nr:hypothetical protein [Streptomyces sp. PsTaAH-130]